MNKTNMMNKIFDINNITFSYPGEQPSVKEISFTVNQGERLALLGANGSGKSTLLHLLDGLYFPQSGSITAFDKILTEDALERPPFGPDFRSKVGFLFQNSDAQLFCSTVEEEIAFSPLQLRWEKAEIMQRIDDTLNLLEISHLRDRTPQNLSGGEKKRVALASLLVVNPSVLLLDEPTAGLDPRSQSMLLEILEQLNEQAGITLITATHDLTLLPHLADRAMVLGEDHCLKADGNAHDILHNTDLLLSVNLIHAHAHRHGDTIHHHPHYHITEHEHSHEIE
jgi:cobalt/nickel transport system ATP-binding protein